jgi:DNA mismatch endonuclease (patch repair protein)
MDKLSPAARSENMRRIKSKDMKPERLVRSLVHKLGYRFRLHRRDLPGKPDLVFASRKKVIFVHGCFWHSHEIGCPDARLPKSNQDYWSLKLKRNKDRDRANEEALIQAGWRVLTIWDCELSNVAVIVTRLRKFLGMSQT